MAQKVIPASATAIQSVDVKVPDMDFSALEKLGDRKVNNATQNFRLFAATTANAESQKAYEQYKNNPIALANALSKLPDMFDDLPESVREELDTKLRANAVSLVKKAQANQQKAYAKENKILAHTNAGLLMKQQAEDVFDMLSDMSAPEGEKQQGIKDIYNIHRAQLVALSNLTDEEGSPLFNETQRAKMLMPKEAAVAGFKNFIYRPELEQLQEWDTNVFQNRDKFMKEMGIDDATYDAMEKTLVARMKQLEDQNTRKIKTQAVIDAAEVLKTNDELKMKLVEENPNVSKKLVKKLAEVNKETVESHWYDPAKQTSPTPIMQTMSIISAIAADPDNTPEGLERKLEMAIDAVNSAQKGAKDANLSEDQIVDLREMLYDSIANPSFVQGIQMLDAKSWIDSVVDANKSDLSQNNPAIVKALEMTGGVETNPDSVEAALYGSGSHRKSLEKQVKSTIKHGWIDRITAHNRAYVNAKKGLYDVYVYLRQGGNPESAKTWLDDIKYNYVKQYNSDWIPESDFDKLHSEFLQGKKPVYFHNGITWEYQGFQNNGAVFKVKL